jgi:Zn-dependent protease
MKWSLKLCEVAGIGIFVHWTFLILIGWIIFADVVEHRDLSEAIGGVGFVLALFGCVVLHELGHALMAKRFGVQTRDITLLPIGGVARLERIPEVPIQEFWVAIAGPAVNVVIAAVLAVVVWLQHGVFTKWETTPTQGEFFSQLMYINIALVVFNMLPAFPMGGGRVLRALLAHFSGDYVRSTQTAASIGQALAMMFGFFGLFAGHPIWMFIALFVYIGAHEESQQAQMRSLFRGVPVREAMMTRVRVLAPDTTLATTAEELLAGAQQDFPVVVDGHVVGMLMRSDVIAALAKGGPQQRVADVMRADCGTVEDAEMLEATFQRMRQGGCSTIPVVHSGAFVGLVTLENVGELAMIHTALRRGRPRSQVDDVFRAE